ncbi:hypothetical protein PLESTB_001472600 [Pleodorina starrii]|uniref:Uncharacterized protein n=1 Tax=Pleodorina starrii TaxID=330485 RepID=A0A9W6F7G5_9CHLO|nr:hypothetical protein PLESTM_000644000 [Pleodorina starrii]GLC59307.1 hypothetical protein PLESTB_001472600 [Pleodorina starrii]GLC74494.1 hypothetical protein PLESTF_001518700 [Pleodorina starrii]
MLAQVQLPVPRGQRLCSVGVRKQLSIACVARPSSHRVSSAPAVAPSSHDELVRPLLALGATVAPLLLQAGTALAKDGEYGLLEGRTVALIHPAVMLFLFGGTLYAGFLGYQWKRTRELGEEIRELKKSLPAVAADGERPASPVDSVITQKEVERKELIKGEYRDKHWWWGSLLLASGVGIAIEGCVNTYMRTGRLFPGPHLYAGAAIVGLWAAAAALVPAMQKGDQNARNAHIALNAANLALFAWQVPTGLEIVGKVFQFTSWP